MKLYSRDVDQASLAYILATCHPASECCQHYWPWVTVGCKRPAIDSARTLVSCQTLAQRLSSSVCQSFSEGQCYYTQATTEQMGSRFTVITIPTATLCVAPLGGLAPPSLRKRVLPQAQLSGDGLHYTAPTKLLVHSLAFKSQLAYDSSSALMPGKSKRPFDSSDDHCLSAPMDLSTSVAKPMSTDTTTMLALHQQLKEQHHVEWLRILEVAADDSDLVKATRDSDNVMLHRARVIAKFSPSTLASYFRCWHQWTAFCKCHVANPHQPPVVLLADFLQVSSKRSALGVATAHSRALTWMSKYAGFPILKQALEAPITRAYTIPSEVVPRKEAAPLPLSFVVYLESCILKDMGTPADRLLMGSILALIWASLRWSDALWVSPGDLVEDADIIRGVAHKTKNYLSGNAVRPRQIWSPRCEFTSFMGYEMAEPGASSLAEDHWRFSRFQTWFFAAPVWPKFGAPAFLCSFVTGSGSLDVEESHQTVTQWGLSA